MVEMSVGEAEARKARSGQRAALSELVRVRLPFNFTPNPVIGEREFLSVPLRAFTSLRARADSLLNAIRGELEQQGVDAWIVNRKASHRLRANRDLWKTMVISSILEAGRDSRRRALVLDYFDGKESLAFALGRIVGLSNRVELAHFEVIVLNPRLVPLDRISIEAVAALDANAWLHAARTADNAKVGEIFLFCFFAAVGFFELGGAEFLAWVLRILRIPAFVGEGAATIGEGFGTLGGTDAPLMQGVFSAFMGFVGYTERVGELGAQGDVSEEEAFGLVWPLLGIIMPVLFGTLALDKVPACIQKIGRLALLPAQVGLSIYSTIHNLLWLVSSFQELADSLAISQEVADGKGTSFLVARDEYEIILPGMPE